jgi:hypothetical protein
MLRRILRDNGLTFAALLLFAGSFLGQAITGLYSYNDELKKLGGAPTDFASYLHSGHFIEATFENWESEFLQMAIFVVLSAFLYQKGSAESNPPPEENAPPAPRLRRYFKGHSVWRKLYENSLSLALFGLFLLSFVAHLYGGLAKENVERRLAGQTPATVGEFFTGADFWFQSFQNWQSEFLSIGAITFLSIYLRQKDSAQSKPVDAPHSKTV